MVLVLITPDNYTFRIRTNVCYITQHFFGEIILINLKINRKKNPTKIVNSICLLRLVVLRVFAVLSVCVCTGHFVMVPLCMACLHCLQHTFL